MAEVSSEYWAYNDPRWAADPAYGNPDTMKYMGPWDQVLQSTGFKGRVFQPAYTEMADPNGGTMLLEYGQQYTPEAKAAIDQLRSSGYDLRWKHPDRSTYNTYWGFVTPEGVQDIKFEGSDVGNIIKPLIKTWGAGLGLANLGAGLNSLLGGAGAGTNALAGIEALAGVPTSPAFAAGMGVDAGMAALGGGAGALTAADLAALPADVLGQIGPVPQVEVANFPSLGDRTVTNVIAQGTQGAEAAVLPQVTAPAEVVVPSLPTRTPLPPISEPLTELQPFPVRSEAAVTAPAPFAPSPLQDLDPAIFAAKDAAVATPNVNALAGIDALAGIQVDPAFAAGMGVDAGIAALTPEVLAQISAGIGAGAGVGGAAGGGAVAPATTTAAEAALPSTAASADSATRAALYGTEGYGAGMTGAQTSAYDAVLGATGSKTAADVAANVAGTGGSILDKAINLIKSPAGGAILSGVGSVVGGITAANAAEAAAEQQSEAARNALALQREMFEYQKSLLEPYRTAGTAALGRLTGAMGLGGPAQQQQMLEMDPGYGFRLGEGLKALERMQAARGNMLSGGAMKAGQRYAQDYASGEYSNAYNRLANIAGLGQTAGTQLGGAAQQFGQTAGNVMGQEANALAAGRIGRGSAYGNAIQGGLNAYSNYLNQQQQNQLFRDIFGRTAIGG